MSRIKSVQPRVKPHTGRLIAPVPVIADIRITGRQLQRRRYRLWLQSPVCAICQRLVTYPHGFELDHKVPLYMGGADTEENCQILCVWFDMVGDAKVKHGCHADKTAKDANDSR